MKSIKKNNSLSKKAIVITLIIVVLVALLGAAAYAKFYGQSANDQATEETSSNRVNLDPATDEQKQAGDEQKRNTADSNVNNDENQATESLGVTITAFNQNDEQVQIRILINEVSSNGSCTLKLESSKGVVITKTSDLQAQPSSSSCKGFDIPSNELSPGDWKATVLVTIGTQTGSANKTLTIQ